MPDFSHEMRLRSEGHLRIAGADEAGRGPLAGPVSAAAVILPEGYAPAGLNDSKKLSEKRREALFEELIGHPEVLVGFSFAEVDEIDRINILRASEAAMRRAVEALGDVDYCLIDGRPVAHFPVASEGLIKGDGKSFSIAAASVIAKVSRDRQMRELAKIYPEYGFDRHKGYGTKAHLEALNHYGPCPIHRCSFAPVAQAARRFGEA
ncbi:MAG: ribonuclease HII [Verrucomicrobiota bacterium JB023]|nr:ribonuclease HII [Verrucomicrobiota bacterium JB023]